MQLSTTGETAGIMPFQCYLCSIVIEGGSTDSSKCVSLEPNPILFPISSSKKRFNVDMLECPGSCMAEFCFIIWYSSPLLTSLIVAFILDLCICMDWMLIQRSTGGECMPITLHFANCLMTYFLQFCGTVWGECKFMSATSWTSLFWKGLSRSAS